jgi:ubiquinone/menaquinone biosynthesis C-methylase UbiE
MVKRIAGGGLIRRFRAPPRVDREEWIDSYDLSVADFDQSFADIRRINRFLGGIAVIRRELDRIIRPTESATLLDLGTGTADIPLAIIRRFRSNGGHLRAVGLDANAKIVEIARREAGDSSNLHLLTGDAGRLPFADGSVDFVTCSLTFHHFSDDISVAALREMVRVSRRAAIVNDLRRGRLPAALIWFVTRASLMHRLTRHDGPLSVMRSRTLGEYREIAVRAGFGHAKVRAHPFWRASLVVMKDDA